MSRGRIDVHAHYLPDGYRRTLAATGLTQVDGMDIPSWTADEHVAFMDRAGIGTSMLSISSPGVHLGDDDAARATCRSANEDGKEAVCAHPGRFGLFGSLPYPDIDGAVAELDYCYDVLDVDGITMLTHVGDTYLGDPALEPLFDQLDRRGARVFIHPTSPCGWERTSLGRPRPMIEFLFDTSRAVVNLILNGTVARHPDVEFVIPHAGAALPSIADRVAAFAFVLSDLGPGVDVYRDLGRLHYDLAGFPFLHQLDAVLAITTAEHLHYGSDYPFTPEAVVHLLAEQLSAAGTPPGSLAATLSDNSVRLFPNLITN